MPEYAKNSTRKPNVGPAGQTRATSRPGSSRSVWARVARKGK